MMIFFIKQALLLHVNAFAVPGVASYAPTAWLSILGQTVKFLRYFFIIPTFDSHIYQIYHFKITHKKIAKFLNIYAIFVWQFLCISLILGSLYFVNNLQKMVRLALLCGGPSLERGISLNSARSVLDHLGADTEIVPIYFDHKLASPVYEISKSI